MLRLLLQCSNYAAVRHRLSSPGRNGRGWPEQLHGVLRPSSSRNTGIDASTTAPTAGTSTWTRWRRWCATAATCRCVDAVTGEDRTRAVLTQIVVEQSKDDDSAFPLDVLRQMVVASGRVTNEAALTYMRGRRRTCTRTPTAPSSPIVPTTRGRRPRTSTRSRSRLETTLEVDALKKRLEDSKSVVSGITIEAGTAEAAPQEGRVRAASSEVIPAAADQHFTGHVV